MTRPTIKHDVPYFYKISRLGQSIPVKLTGRCGGGGGFDNAPPPPLRNRKVETVSGSFVQNVDIFKK